MITPTICGALAVELREVREGLDAMAAALIADELVALKHLGDLQNFDLFSQRIVETADLLERIAAGACGEAAVADVRLERLQQRLLSELKAA